MATGLSTNGPRDEFDGARADLTNQLNALKSDLSELGDIVRKLASSGAGVAADKATSKAREAEVKGREVAHHVASALEENSAQIAEYARRKPMTALAVAAAAGLVVGYITAPRR